MLPAEFELKSMLPAEFEITIPESERPQNHALDRAATGTGKNAKRKYKHGTEFVTLKKIPERICSL